MVAAAPPSCPRCFEADLVRPWRGLWWCERCVSFTAAGPLPGRVPPDFDGPALRTARWCRRRLRAPKEEFLLVTQKMLDKAAEQARFVRKLARQIEAKAVRLRNKASLVAQDPAPGRNLTALRNTLEELRALALDLALVAAGGDGKA